MTRTIVISDLHGNVDLLDSVLAHSSFGTEDRLVVAGDMIDVGHGDVISAVTELGATILVGNHEVAAATGLRISPQDAASLQRGAEFAENVRSGSWMLATAVEGWLITHAGVSIALEDIIAKAGRQPDAVASALNELFEDEMQRALARAPLSAENLDEYRLMGGEMGPLWFRPFDTSRIPSGLRQVVGHTPPELLSKAQLALLEGYGWRLIEPGGRAGQDGTVRYAVIENGLARVVEG